MAPGFHNDYIEGDILQGAPHSGFNLMVVDLAASAMDFIHYVRSGDAIYRSKGQSVSRQFVRNSARLRNEFCIDDEFSRQLEDLGVTIRHPRGNLKLSDIYLYPDLQKMMDHSPTTALAKGPEHREAGNKGPGQRPSTLLLSSWWRRFVTAR